MSSMDTVSGQGLEKVRVKWFNRIKGFGFCSVENSSGEPDAFIHMSALEKFGLRDLPEGAELLVQLGDGPKGRQVHAIHNVLDGNGASPKIHAPRHQENSHKQSFDAQRRYNGDDGYSDRGHTSNRGSGSEETINGTVKWFKEDKGFGFVMPEDGQRDVFVHRSVILRAGVESIDPGVKVRMVVQSSPKGREAISIEIIG